MTAPKPSSLARSSEGGIGKRLEQILGKDWKIALLFVAPIVILMLGLIFWPFINAIGLSMTVRQSRREVFVGLANYGRLLADEQFLGALINTIRFTVISVALKLVVGLTIASLLNSKLPGRNILAGLMLLPWIVPEVVTALTWRGLYDPIFGGLNPILQGLGITDRDIGWLSEPGLALPSVIAVNIWKGIPFFTMLLLAGLKAIDKELYEAAEVDGANAVDRFFNITLPGLRYVLAVTVLLSTISTFNSFGIVYLMTGGGPSGETRLYSILAYERALLQNRFGPGAAVSLAVAPLLGIFILMLARFMRHGVDRSNSTKESAGDRALGLLGKGLNAVMSAIVWPISWATRVIEQGVGQLVRALTGGTRTTFLSRKQREGTGIALRALALLPFLVFVLFPFVWVVITAFKGELQIQQRVSIWWPEPWTLEQFNTLLTKTRYPLWFRNTVFIATVTTALSVLFAALGGYALARLKFRGAGVLTTVLLITYLLPGSLLFIPMYQILTTLGRGIGVPVINSHLALILTYPTFLMPFATWVMLGYYRGIPEDLEEAAMIDGANRFTAFWRITLPLAMPALLSVTLFAFTNAWNEFLYAFIFLTSETLITLPVGLQKLVFADLYPYGQLMAASLIMSIPVVIIYIFAQRFVVEGLTAGSVKG
jgi:multiple sugar transport system permease protein